MFNHSRYKVIVSGLLFYSILLTILTYVRRLPHLDDAWLGEQSYWLTKDGVVRSQLFQGLIKYEERILVYHKLFVWLGAVLIKAVGWGLYNIKSISVIALFLFILFAKYHF